MSLILVVGNGGREHALAFRLAQSASVAHVYVAPGNGGTATAGGKISNIPIGLSPADFPALVEFAQSHNVLLVVPGPEQPLVDGITLHFVRVGIPVFGPLAKAAQMEGSKALLKDFMARHQIPTAAYRNFSDFDAAVAFVKSAPFKVVIKASGIAAGKGVILPATTEEAVQALREIMVERVFGTAGDEVVVEELLEGEELLILSFSDGYTQVDLPPAQDHKRIGNGDTGLNTGGMGAYAPAPVATPALLAEIRSTILEPLIAGMRRDGFPFVGVLFTGVMVTATGPKVLEYNVRFGDPETQTVLPLLTPETDLAEVMLACAEGRLDSVEVAVDPTKFATTVVLAAGGYPEAYGKGDEITIKTPLPEDSWVFQAGTAIVNDKLVTAGGRVLAATATGASLREAVDAAYRAAKHIAFNGAYHRDDIAHRGLAAKRAQLTYETAGVSVDAGNRLVEQIKASVKLTARAGADSDIGGFGGVFDLAAAGYVANDTLLVAATDGVGTKLRIAQQMGIHDTVGIDLVAMNVNDLVVQGAEPLLFLDYFATGALDIAVAEAFVRGVAAGCKLAGCALVGGETLEMPGMYAPGHYDTNGTAVGAVKRGAMLPDTGAMKEGDVLLGLASDGVHSNGFSLVRRVVEAAGVSWSDAAPFAEGTIGEAFLVPTRIYVKSCLAAVATGKVLGMAHVTGGGLVENVPRCLPKGLAAKVVGGLWEVPKVFGWLAEQGNVPRADMLKTFNMGVGMVVVVAKENAAEVKQVLEKAGEVVYEIGVLEKGEGCYVEE